jgi:hypothetical protein
METSNEFKPPTRDQSISQILRDVHKLDREGKENLFRKWNKDRGDMANNVSKLKAEDAMSPLTEARKDQLKFYINLIDIYESVLREIEKDLL